MTPLVYGDRVRTIDLHEAMTELRDTVARLAELPTWLARHSALVGAFIRTSEIAQGLADRSVHGAVDARTPLADTAMRVLVALARAGLCHGFLVERWIDHVPREVDRTYLVERVGRYLAFRARAFPAAPGSGASIAELREMCRKNIDVQLPSVAEPRRVEIDGKMQAWEWITDDRGELVKTDALDHCCSHDLIGCQGIAWDLAGAAIELDLDDAETERLAAIAGAPVPEPFWRLAYLAFQVGRNTLADNTAEVERYATLVRVERVRG